MSYTNNFLSNIYSNQLCDLFNKNINNDLIPSQDDVYNLGSSTRRWNELHIDNIKSSGSPLANFVVSGQYLIGGGVWSSVIPTSGFALKISLNQSTGLMTYTGPNKFVRISANAQFLRQNTNTNAGIALVVNNSPVMVSMCHVDTASAVVSAVLNHNILLNTGDTFRFDVSCETGACQLSAYTFLGYTSPAVAININECLSNT